MGNPGFRELHVFGLIVEEIVEKVKRKSYDFGL